MELTQTIRPVNYPISLKEVKTFLRVEHNDEDNELINMIIAATDVVERYLSRGLITQTWKMTMDYLPSSKIKLYYSPVVSITSIKLTSLSSVETTIDADKYYLSDKTNVPLAVLKYGQVWDTVILQPSAGVEVITVCGYGDTPNDVPYGIKQGLLNVLAAMYENREEGAIITSPAKSLLNSHRVYAI